MRRMRAFPSILRAICVLTLGAAALVGGAGCSTFSAYPDQVRYAQNAFEDADFDEAVRALDRTSFPSSDRLLPLLEAGVFHHAQGDYTRSNDRLLKAVDVMREYDERAYISVRDAAAFAA